MDNATRWSLLAAPILGPLIWWAWMYPGRKVRNWIWRSMPDGKLRNLLLYKIPGTKESPP
jgi:hypothetical protein